MFYQKLNTVWHKRALSLFMFVVLAHWAEHLGQAYQIYVLGWPRPKAGGFLGLFYPWLVSTELLHYGYAIVMLIGLWTLRRGFSGTSRKWWTIALVIQFLAPHRACSAAMAGAYTSLLARLTRARQFCANAAAEVSG